MIYRRGVICLQKFELNLSWSLPIILAGWEEDSMKTSKSSAAQKAFVPK